MPPKNAALCRRDLLSAPPLTREISEQPFTANSTCDSASRSDSAKLAAKNLRRSSRHRRRLRGLRRDKIKGMKSSLRSLMLDAALALPFHFPVGIANTFNGWRAMERMDANRLPSAETGTSGRSQWGRLGLRSLGSP
jgi:hypothetical protein